MGEEGLAGAGQVLLRPLRAEPRSASGGGDNERDLGRQHGFETPGRLARRVEAVRVNGKVG
jgi:hypothetical protein